MDEFRVQLTPLASRSYFGRGAELGPPVLNTKLFCELNGADMAGRTLTCHVLKIALSLRLMLRRLTKSEVETERREVNDHYV